MSTFIAKIVHQMGENKEMLQLIAADARTLTKTSRKRCDLKQMVLALDPESDTEINGHYFWWTLTKHS